MSTCNQLDLETVGFQLIMFKNLPGRAPDIDGNTHSNQ